MNRRAPAWYEERINRLEMCYGVLRNLCKNYQARIAELEAARVVLDTKGGFIELWASLAELDKMIGGGK